MGKQSLDYYEKRQAFNSIIAWVHSLRYRSISKVFESYSKQKDGPIRVVDIGCSHAKIFSVLNKRFNIHYTGLDPRSDFVAIARARYQQHQNFEIIHGLIQDHYQKLQGVDMVIALETLEHIPENIVVRIVEEIAAAKPNLFVCSVPVEIGPAVWMKNFGSFLMRYLRHREYSLRETFWAGLYQLDKIPPHDTRHKGFDWRWLAQTIRHHFHIRKRWNLPIKFLPAAFSSSVFFIAEVRSLQPPSYQDNR